MSALLVLELGWLCGGGQYSDLWLSNGVDIPWSAVLQAPPPRGFKPKCLVSREIFFRRQRRKAEVGRFFLNLYYT